MSGIGDPHVSFLPGTGTGSGASGFDERVWGLDDPDHPALPVAPCLVFVGSLTITIALAVVPWLAEVSEPAVARVFFLIFALSAAATYAAYRPVKRLDAAHPGPRRRISVSELPKALQADAMRMLRALAAAESTVRRLRGSALHHRLEAQLPDLRSAAWRALSVGRRAHDLGTAGEVAIAAQRDDLVQLVSRKLSKLQRPLAEQANRFEAVARSLAAIEAGMRLNSPAIAQALHEEATAFAGDEVGAELRLSSVEDEVASVRDAVADMAALLSMLEAE